jgi:hypothetical protein
MSLHDNQMHIRSFHYWRHSTNGGLAYCIDVAKAAHRGGFFSCCLVGVN